ncbi:MAG: zinc-ribbon domain containing protein [Burkholderiales bacterium]|nr:zinc-ribbon domain containing protein [Burkholderiales bacterium]
MSRRTPDTKDRPRPRPKSGKQRARELRAARKERALHPPAPRHDPRKVDPDADTAPCNPALLAHYNSYGQPEFVARGYYVDTPFTCVGCGKSEIWRATQQKWWYEVAKGNVETIAKRCRSCRRSKREASATSRMIHLKGLVRSGKSAS